MGDSGRPKFAWPGVPGTSGLGDTGPQLRLRFFLLLFLASATPAAAQHYLEFRGADTKYRFADWNFTFSNAVAVDVFYVGVPGSNEFNMGGGYAFKIGSSLTLTPLVYAVVGKEAGQRGIKTALLASFDRAGWKGTAFMAHYSPVSGDVGRYQVLDTLDFTRVVGRSWEVGVSSGFFHSGGDWNPQVGPMVKRNDRLGSWSFSYRFGPQKEMRAVRTFLIQR